MNRFPLRRHELALLGLVILTVALVAFWFGRATAPNRTLSYEDGKREGAQLERERLQRSQTELELLKAEAASAKPTPSRSASKTPPETLGTSSDDSTSGETASGADN